MEQPHRQYKKIEEEPTAEFAQSACGYLLARVSPPRCYFSHNGFMCEINPAADVGPTPGPFQAQQFH